MEQITFLNNKSKVEIAIERLKTFEPKEGYYLAFSGGKDSIVINRLAEMAEVKFEANYNHTTVDPPELIYFIRDNYKNVKWNYPEKTMWQLIEHKLMPPTMLIRYCCSELKEKGGEGRFVITGVRWAESSRRKRTRSVIENFHKNKKYKFGINDNDEGRMMIENCIKKGKFILNPIVDWSDDDVWKFIKEQKLKYCSLYDEGFKRLGCIGCPMAGYGEKRLRDFKRWPKYKQMYLKSFERMLKNRIKKGKEKQWTTGEEVFDWWINEHKSEKVIENQVKMEV